jgi:hypothetical protein
LSLLATFDGTGHHWTPTFRLGVTPENHKQKPVHATGVGLERHAPARSPMANGLPIRKAASCRGGSIAEKDTQKTTPRKCHILEKKSKERGQA